MPRTNITQETTVVHTFTTQEVVTWLRSQHLVPTDFTSFSVAVKGLGVSQGASVTSKGYTKAALDIPLAGPTADK